MKYFLYNFLIILVIKLPVNAQLVAPNSSLNSIVPFQIQVSNKVTTVISFPYSVVNADCGIGALKAEKVPGMENVIKIKAATPNMDTTSLHVFTGDGKIHVFQVGYHPAPPISTYDLQYDDPVLAKFLSSRYTGSLNEKELNIMVSKVRVQKRFIYRGNRKFKITLSLHGVYVHNNIIFLKFNISNQSRLSFQADWANLYIQDKKVTSRTSVQQLSVSPVYADELPCVDGEYSKDWIIAIPKLTVPDKKHLIFELQEEVGGRHIAIKIRNKDLFRANRI